MIVTFTFWLENFHRQLLSNSVVDYFLEICKWKRELMKGGELMKRNESFFYDESGKVI